MNGLLLSWDRLALVGAILLINGLFWAWPPLAPIALGLLVGGLGVWGAWLQARAKKEKES